MALLLGLVCKILWAKVAEVRAELAALRAYYEGDPNDPNKKGKIAEIQAAAQLREDKLRNDSDRLLREAWGEQKALMQDLAAALRGDLPSE